MKKQKAKLSEKIKTENSDGNEHSAFESRIAKSRSKEPKIVRQGSIVTDMSAKTAGVNDIFSQEMHVMFEPEPIKIN